MYCFIDWKKKKEKIGDIFMSKKIVRGKLFMTFLFSFVSLFSGITTFVGYLMLKPSFEKNISCNIWPIVGRIKRIHTLPKSIFSKVNVIARLYFELTYYDSVVHRFNHFTTRTPLWLLCERNRHLNLRADVVLSMSRGPPGQWFPETEYVSVRYLFGNKWHTAQNNL